MLTPTRPGLTGASPETRSTTMKSGSWASYIAAGALGDNGPDDDPAPPMAQPIDDMGRLQDLGYRVRRDADGQWTVAKGDEIIGNGQWAIEAWDSAIRRFLADHPEF
jgi:hypothetical protein